MTSAPGTPSTTTGRSALDLVMSVWVILTILGAARAVFAVETTALRVALVGWIAFGVAVLWLRRSRAK